MTELKRIILNVKCAVLEVRPELHKNKTYEFNVILRKILPNTFFVTTCYQITHKLEDWNFFLSQNVMNINKNKS